MKKLFLALLACLLLPSPATAADVEPVFDTRAVDAFWPLVEILQQDLEPPVEMWDELLETDAIRSLADQGMGATYFERLIGMAFRPSMATYRDAALGDPQLGPTVSHFLEAWERRDEVERAMRGLARQGLAPELLQQLRGLLPARIPSERPPIAFAIFGNAGRGGDPLVIDPLAILKWDVPPYLAHELHHWYREQLLDFDPDTLDPADRELVGWLDALQSEGTADLLDKGEWVESPDRAAPDRRPYAERYAHALAHTDDAITALDDALARWDAAETPAARRTAARSLAEELPLGGHPVGYHMVRTIVGTMGQPALVETLGNPFGFARLYDESARRAGDARPFSDEAMRALRRLESAYVGTGSSGE